VEFLSALFKVKGLGWGYYLGVKWCCNTIIPWRFRVSIWISNYCPVFELYFTFIFFILLIFENCVVYYQKENVFSFKEEKRKAQNCCYAECKIKKDKQWLSNCLYLNGEQKIRIHILFVHYVPHERHRTIQKQRKRDSDQWSFKLAILCWIFKNPHNREKIELEIKS